MTPTSSITVDPILQLRAATHRLHQTLDSGLPLAGPAPGLMDYAQHLCVLRDWEAAISGWLRRTGADSDSLVLIGLDLADCAGADQPAALPALSPKAVHTRDDGSLAFCWGIRYVLEGSRLGSQVLWRRLRERLAPHPLRYLSASSQARPGWPEIVATLRSQLAAEAALRAGCEGAEAAFELLLARFRQAGALA
jgi:heme oxygenase